MASDQLVAQLYEAPHFVNAGRNFLHGRRSEVQQQAGLGVSPAFGHHHAVHNDLASVLRGPGRAARFQFQRQGFAQTPLFVSGVKFDLHGQIDLAFDAQTGRPNVFFYVHHSFNGARPHLGRGWGNPHGFSDVFYPGCRPGCNPYFRS